MGSRNGKQRKSTKPKIEGETLTTSSLAAVVDGYPLLSMRHVQGSYDIGRMTEEQRSEFLLKWWKRSDFTWQELGQHPKHGLGWEMLKKTFIKPSVPEELEQDKYMVFRHKGNLPFVGFKAGDVFHVLWVATSYEEVYDH